MESVEKTDLNVIWHPHPVVNSVGRQNLSVVLTKRTTIREVLIQSGIDTHQPIVITVDDKMLRVEEWDTVYPYAGQIINVQASVTGGGDGGSNALQIVAMIAVVAVAAIIAGPIGAAYFGNAAIAGTVAAVVSVGGSLLIGAIFAPTPQSVDFNNAQTSQASPTYSLTGGSNAVRPYQPMPVLMGYHRLFPDYGARPYSEYHGNDQYLYQIFHFGLATADYSDYKIGTTPITSYQDYEWIDTNVDGQLTEFPSNVDTLIGANLTNEASWIERTSSPEAYQLGIDIVGTFYYANDEGGLSTASATIEIEYKLTSTLIWSDTITKTLSGASQSPVRQTYFITVPAVGTYDVRVRRTTADSTESRLQNKTVFDVLRTYQLDEGNYLGQTRKGLIIRASEQLSGTIQQLSAIGDAYANYWNGTAWVNGKTSNPAHWFMDFAKGRYDSNGKLLYGVGFTDLQIDLESLNAWAQFCSDEGLTFNAVLDNTQTAAEIIMAIARCGFASPSWASGKLGIVWDARNQSPTAAFGMSNIIKGSFEVTYLTEQLADEIVVSFVNPEKDWAQDEVRVTIPEIENPLRSSTVTLFGCTSKTMAGKFANYLAAQQYYRKRRITWESDFEGFVCQRGDVVLLSHDLTQWGYSGRIVGVKNFEAIDDIEDVDADWGGSFDNWNGGDVIVKLSRPVPRNGNIEYLAIRKPNGDLTTYQVLPASTESDELLLVLPPDFDMDYNFIDHIWFFSPLETTGKKVKIISIQPSSESRVRITATDEDEAFYIAWDGEFIEAPQNTLLLNPTPSVFNVNISEFVYRGGDGNVISLVTVTYQAKSVERSNIRWRINGGTWSKLTIYSNSFEFTAEESGNLEIDILPINGSLIGESAVATSFIFGQQSNQLPPDVTNIITTYDGALGGRIVLNWVAVNDFRQPNILYEVRLGTSWESGKVLGRTPLTQFTAQGDGTHWVSAVYVNSGVSLYSANPVSIDVIGATIQKNVVATYDESVLWDGTLDGDAEITISNVLQLATSGGEVVGTEGSYTIPNTHIVDAGKVTPCNLSITIGGGGVAVDDNVLDLTNVLTASDLLNSALGVQVTIQAQIAIAGESGVFGAWQNFLAGFYNGRYFKARVLISTSDVSINAVVTDFIFSVDVPDRVDTGQVTTNVAGSTVTYVSSFIGGATGMTVPAVQLTIVNAQAGDDIILSNETFAGFDVQILNGGSGVVRTVNWLAQGY
jgi:predicted phage tail protein